MAEGKIVDVKLGKNNTSLLSIKVGGKTITKSFNGELLKYKGLSIHQVDGQWNIIQATKNKHVIDLSKRKELGVIIGGTKSTSFDFRVNQQLEDDVCELSFIVTNHKMGVALGQITRIKRTEDGDNIARVEVLGIYGKKNLMLPRTPFFQNAVIKLAKEEDVNAILKMDEKEGLYLGKIHETDIRVFVDTKKLLAGGVNVFAVKGAGKTYLISVLCEELTKKGIPVIIIDPHGEYYFKFPNRNNEEMEKASKFGIEPRLFTNQLVLSFNKEINKLSDAQISYKHLMKQKFYTDFLVKPGQISIINCRGLPIRIQREQVARLLSTLFDLRKNEKIPPFVLVVEELKKFAPQHGRRIKSLTELEDISSEGRKFGVGVCLISQRPADVNKTVVGQTENYLILRMGYDKAWVLKNVMGAKNYGHLLDKLPTGTAYVSGLFEVPLLIDIRIRESLHLGQNINVSSMLFEGKANEQKDLQGALNKIV